MVTGHIPGTKGTFRFPTCRQRGGTTSPRAELERQAGKARCGRLVPSNWRRGKCCTENGECARRRGRCAVGEVVAGRRVERGVAQGLADGTRVRRARDPGGKRRIFQPFAGVNVGLVVDFARERWPAASPDYGMGSSLTLTLRSSMVTAHGWLKASARNIVTAASLRATAAGSGFSKGLTEIPNGIT